MISIVLEFFSFLSTNLVQTTSIVKKISVYFLIISVVSLFYTDVSLFNTAEWRYNTDDLRMNTDINNYASSSFRKCFLLASWLFLGECCTTPATIYTMNHNQLSPGDRSVCTFDKTSMKWAFFVSDVSRFQENFRLGMRISERFQNDFRLFIWWKELVALILWVSLSEWT